MAEATAGQGKIVILSKSRFEKLNENEINILKNLKSLSLTLGLTSRLGAYLQDMFVRSGEPYVLAMKLAYCCGDFNSCRTKSLAVFVITKIMDLLKTNTILAPTDPELKKDALILILEQKNITFRDLVIDVFDMRAHSEYFIPVIRELIEKKMFKDACQVSQSLKLFQQFAFEDFVIPLCLQDKEPVVENYLHKDQKLRHDFLKFMDNLLIDDAFVSYFNNFIEVNQIPHTRNFTSRGLVRFLNRLLKYSSESTDICPNLIQRNLRGTMRYYLAKRFESNSPESESWSEMMFEVVGARTDLQKELIESLYEKGLLDEALSWARKFSLPEELWPPALLNYTADKPCELKVKQLSEDQDVEYYELPRNDMIVIVDNKHAFDAFISTVAAAKIVSFDTEWKPSFSYVENDVSLLQIATRDKIYIIDRIALVQSAPYFSVKLVDQLFHNKGVLKIGFSVGGDIKLLRSTFPELNNIYSLLDLFDLRTVLTTVHKFQFPCPVKNGEVGGKLLDLAQLALGKTLDKTEQCSNWEKRPLRPSQIAYAAVDAYCLLEIYDVICSECKRQSIHINDVIQELQVGRSPKRDLQSSVSVKDFRMICTWELCRLVKRLRSCGIDANYNNANHPTKRTLKLLRKGYVVLTTVDQNWLRGVRSLRVPVADEKTQLHHVLQKYSIKVKSTDINTRCRDCNKTDFMKLSVSEMRNLAERVKKGRDSTCVNAMPAGMEDDECSLDDIVEEEDDDYYEADPGPRTGGPVEMTSYWTSRGAPVRSEDIPAQVFDIAESFTVCEWCGTVMWPVTFENLFEYN